MGVFDRIALATLPLLPRPLMRVLASRYIAGEELADALARLRKLRDQGFQGILDILGEGVEDEAAAQRVADAYAHATDVMADTGLDAYVSVKPTHVGILISEELAYELYARILERVEERNSFLRVEMEDHPTTDATLRVFERLRAHSSRVGLVLQARLFRTLEDIDRLAPGPLNVRMVKGIYLEPPEIAHVDAEPIRRAFLDCTRKLLEREAYVSLATHDERMAESLLEMIRELGVGPERYEFQVLLGVRESLWHLWLQAGHPVRVYVPYGPEWREYSTRRLHKNPQIFRHVVRDFFLRR